MHKVVLLALLVFLICGVQESQQQRCSDHYCTRGSNCGCDGCCYGLHYDYGRCYSDKCYCYYSPKARSQHDGGSDGTTTLPPSS